MDLLNTIESDLKESLKSKDSLKAETLRMIKSDIMYEKTKKNEDLTNEKVLEIVTRASKKRKESIKEYNKANRSDLAQKEEKELEIIQKYLPEQLSESEVEAIIDEKLKVIENLTKNDFGKVMGMLMKDLKGKVDGNIVRQLINKKFENL